MVAIKPPRTPAEGTPPARTASTGGRSAREWHGPAAEAASGSPIPPAAEQRDEAVVRRIQHARQTLAQAGLLEGGKDARVTVRLQGALLDAARRRTGIQSESALVSAGLALLAAGDDYGAWLVAQRGGLSDDFDLGL